MLNAEGANSSAPIPPRIPVCRSSAKDTCRPNRIRHLLMTADAVGGVWQYTLDLGRALAERGVRTTIAVMGPPPRTDQRYDAERAGIAVIDRPYRLEWMDDPWDDVQRAGLWLLTLERALQPDVVHLNGYTHASLPWTSPVVTVAHSCVRSWWRSVKNEHAPAGLEAYSQAVAAGLTAARLVIAPTAAMLQALHDEYGVTVPSRVIPNGCASLVEPMWHAKEDLVLAAGRVWDEAKNIAALCDVADRLPWPVYVAGETRAPERGACTLAAVRSLGQVNHAVLSAWYGRASVYALPARYEPFGLSVLEAARGGCALVLGDIPSLRENWAGAAVFVPPNDRTALLSAIERLTADHDYRRALAVRAWSRAAQFTIDRTADEYLRAYEDVLG